VSISSETLRLPMDDNAASTTVAAEAGSDGTLIGGDNTEDLFATESPALLDGSLHLDGSTDYIDCGAPAEILDDTQGSVVVWLKMDALLSEDDVAVVLAACETGTDDFMWFNVRRRDAMFSGETHLEVNSRISGNTNWLVADGALDTNWHCAALTSNGSTWKTFLDGIEKSLTPVPTGDYTNTGDWFGDRTFDAGVGLYVGARDFSGMNKFFDGYLADVRIYSVALTPGQIKQIYNEGLGTQDSLADLYAENNGILRPVLQLT